MSNTMTYKGYAARIGYDDDDGIFTRRIAGIRDGIGFHADSAEGLRQGFRGEELGWHTAPRRLLPD